MSNESEYWSIFNIAGRGLVLLSYALYIWSIVRLRRAAREAAQRGRQAVADAFAYIDAYYGLIPPGEAAETVRELRRRMSEAYKPALAKLSPWRTEKTYQRMTREFLAILLDFDRAREQIKLVTAGTGVGFRVTSAPAAECAPLFDPVPGVSFFSSQPASDLIPVEVAINGKRRSVMATPAEREAMVDGHLPGMLLVRRNDRLIPWFDARHYDPRRDWPIAGGGLAYGSIKPEDWGGIGHEAFGWSDSPLDGVLLGWTEEAIVDGSLFIWEEDWDDGLDDESDSGDAEDLSDSEEATPTRR